MPAKIMITRNNETKRFWVIRIEKGEPNTLSSIDHLRSFLFNGDEDAAYGLAEVFAEGIVQGFRLTSGLLPKDVEYLTR